MQVMYCPVDLLTDISLIYALTECCWVTRGSERAGAFSGPDQCLSWRQSL